jgi:hypothetical protein
MGNRREDDPRGDQGEPTQPDRQALYQQVAQYYRDYLGRDGSPDEINGWLDSGQTIDAIGQGIRDSDEAKAHAAPSAASAPAPGDRAGATGPPATAAPTAPPASGLGGLGAGLGGTSFTQPFPGQFTPPAQPTGPPSWWTPPPTFNAPAYRQAPAFQAPTLADALNDPGYQFAADEGRNALERSAAARGTLNTGGTLKDILSWGGNYAQQRYNDVWGRSKDAYTTNYQTQYADPYAAAFQGALATYTPQFTGWQGQMQATQRSGEQNQMNAWNQFLQVYDQWRNLQSDVWGRYRDATNI